MWPELLAKWAAFGKAPKHKIWPKCLSCWPMREESGEGDAGILERMEENGLPPSVLIFFFALPRKSRLIPDCPKGNKHQKPKKGGNRKCFIHKM
jgi:hypothetical protein